MSRRSQGIATWVLTVGFCLIAASVWALEIVRQKNVATFITFPLIDSSDDVSLKTGAAASGDSEIDTWADGTTGAPDGFADVSGEIAEIGSTGVYYLSLTATEMNYDYIAVKVTATGVNPQFLLIRTTAGSHKNMATTDDGGTINVTTGAVDTVGTVNGLASGVITATAIADDAIDAGAIAENAIGASEIAASAITTSELVSGTVTLANGAHGGAAASFTFGAGGTISSSSGTALTITSSGGNGHGIEIDGNGTGNGVDISGGTYGILSAGGSTGARFAGTSSVGLQAIGPNVGFYAIGSSGHGAVFEGQGDPGHGLYLDKGTSGYDLYLGTPDTNLPVSGASAADIADAVWDEDITYHSTADSAGAALLLIDDISAGAGVPVSYAPSSATRTIGDDEGGTYSNLAARDDSNMVTGENATTGLSLLVARSSSTTTETPSLVRVCGFYGGPQSHQVYIQAYNYDTTAWDTLSTMQNRSGPFDYVVPLNSHYDDDSTGEMQLRFLHSTMTYNASDALTLDFVSWEKVETNSAIASDVAQILSVIGTPLDTTLSRDIGNVPAAVDTQLSETHGPGPWR